MSTESTAIAASPGVGSGERSGRKSGAVIHPAWVRAAHWVNALAMVVMIGSGWRIYDASPLFPFVFPEQLTLGYGLAGALLWHFAAMWLLIADGIVYLALGLLTGRFRRKFFPIQPREFVSDLIAALTSASRMTTCPSTTRCRSSSMSG